MGCTVPEKSISAEQRCTAACALITWHKERGYIKLVFQMSLYILFVFCDRVPDGFIQCCEMGSLMFLNYTHG